LEECSPSKNLLFRARKWNLWGRSNLLHTPVLKSY
jgi:hypothetical protein